MKKGTHIYWINEHGEHIPGVVLKVGKRIKVALDDLTGDRTTWVERHKLEIQKP